jgi:RNA polymerase sigma-70 factor (ECF subfamily)
VRATKPALSDRCREEERRLVEALRAGDQSAFQALIERHDPMMRRVARSFVHSDAIAEEVIQETWLAVVSGIARFEGRSALTTWIYAILTNQARSHGVREKRSLPFCSLGRADRADEPLDADSFQKDDQAWPGHWATPPRPWQKPERRLLSLEAREQLKLAFDRLPERQRTVVTLRDIEDLKAEEVCELLDLSLANQRVLLHRGRARLRAELAEYIEGASAVA